MARSRNIKPSFFQNESLGELDPIDRIAFIGLWTVADFKGCVEFRPKRLKIQLLPYDDCDFEEIAINLDKSGLIRNYSVQGIRYIKIINFEKHQNPHKNERESGSDIPDIDEDDSQVIDNKEIAINLDKSGLIRNLDGSNPADSLNLIPDSLNLIPESKDMSLPTPKTKVLVPYEKIVSLYNEILTELPSVVAITEKRKMQVKKLWLAKPGINDLQSWVEYFNEVKTIKFFHGENERGWKADFDFITKYDKFVAIVEGGKYK